MLFVQNQEWIVYFLKLDFLFAHPTLQYMSLIIVSAFLHSAQTS